jgi:hypothetical protein
VKETELFRAFRKKVETLANCTSVNAEGTTCECVHARPSVSMWRGRERGAMPDMNLRAGINAGLEEYRKKECARDDRVAHHGLWCELVRSSIEVEELKA